MKEYTRFVEKYLTRREKFVQPSEGYIYIFFDQSIWPVRPMNVEISGTTYARKLRLSIQVLKA